MRGVDSVQGWRQEAVTFFDIKVGIESLYLCTVYLCVCVWNILESNTLVEGLKILRLTFNYRNFKPALIH